MIRVLVADDQALVRAGFAMIIAAEADMEVVGEVPDGGAAVREALRLRPDVVLMDVRMPRLDGIAATEELVRAGATARVVILTTFDLDEYVWAALRAGASGFLLKDVDPQDLVAGLRAVVRGESLLGPTVTRRLIERFVARPLPGAAPPVAGTLTERELEVLRLIAQGRSNAEIGRQLFLAEPTVKTHVTHLLRKLDLRDRVQAVVFAYESGLAEGPGAPGTRKAPGR